MDGLERDHPAWRSGCIQGDGSSLSINPRLQSERPESQIYNVDTDGPNGNPNEAPPHHRQVNGLITSLGDFHRTGPGRVTPGHFPLQEPTHRPSSPARALSAIQNRNTTS
ncbi:hypothetical protein BD410DRAFT_365060 [Rickenella mellea]|uniref:Uncharacterized protein n=1 Tax=Rickenella mellea TaxID=50990 RepID=A0A4Y7Q0H8_9AGAM|nr:hypothetical protein BD410DRAFT_365060 [Rickenella mellea]